MGFDPNAVNKWKQKNKKSNIMCKVCHSAFKREQGNTRKEKKREQDNKMKEIQEKRTALLEEQRERDFCEKTEQIKAAVNLVTKVIGRDFTKSQFHRRANHLMRQPAYRRTFPNAPVQFGITETDRGSDKYNLSCHECHKPGKEVTAYPNGTCSGVTFLCAECKSKGQDPCRRTNFSRCAWCKQIKRDCDFCLNGQKFKSPSPGFKNSKKSKGSAVCRQCFESVEEI